MITRTEQEIRRLRQQLADAPIPPGLPPALQEIIDNLPRQAQPGPDRPIHPDSDQMLTEWNTWIEAQHGRP